MEGIAIFYKQKGQTSYDVIRDLKKRLNETKIGHGGTLDPLAEGVLIIGIGKEGTKQLTEFLKGKEKEYIAEIVLGAVTDTFDAEGQLSKDLSRPGLDKWPSEKAILDTLKQFQGEFLQTPPKFSAVKISGQPAYKLARQGKEFTLSPKKVEVIDIKLLDYSPPELKLKLLVKSGFYVRSFADDLGKILKTGAYLKGLTRTRIGDFKIEEAIRQEDLENDFLELYFKAQGGVQGVLFRDTTRRWAKKLQLIGKAENLPNGEIEIISQGKNKNLDEFLEKIKKGPAFARVDKSFHYFRKPETMFQNFNIY